MSGALRPIALTCGEPAGIGAEIAVLARAALPDLPFFWLGDPRHLAQGTPFAEISTPDQAPLVPKGVLPVLAHRFAGQACKMARALPFPVIPNSWPIWRVGHRWL